MLESQLSPPTHRKKTMIINDQGEPKVTELVDFVIDFTYKMMLMIIEMLSYDASLIPHVYLKPPVYFYTVSEKNGSFISKGKLMSK